MSFPRSTPRERAPTPREASAKPVGPSASSRHTNRTHGHRRQCASQPDLDRQRDRHKLQRQARHHHRRPVHENLFANRNEFHRHRPHQRHHVFLRRLRGQFRRRKRKLRASQRHACRSNADLLPRPPVSIATAGNAQISLTWTASSGATSYHVKRSTTTGGPYTQVSAPTTTAFTDTGLTNGTTYFYVVSALNSAGESANSTQASATPANTSGAMSPSPSIPPTPNRSRRTSTA